MTQVSGYSDWPLIRKMKAVVNTFQKYQNKKPDFEQNMRNMKEKEIRLYDTIIISNKRKGEEHEKKNRKCFTGCIHAGRYDGRMRKRRQ